MTPEESRAEMAAKAEAFKRITASLRYISARYGQAAAAMQQVTNAWNAAAGGSAPGGSGSPHVPDASAGVPQVPPGGNGGSAAGAGGGWGTNFTTAAPGGGGGGSWSSNPHVHTGTPGVAWGSAGGGSSVSGAGGGGGYASGGLVVTPGSVFGAGAGDFDGGGPPVVAGSVTGYRWWTFPAPDLSRNPLDADDEWDTSGARLTGAWADWQPGVNNATCLANPDPAGPPPHDLRMVPARSCGCGYWAYWGVQRHVLNRAGHLLVFGVIKGFGRTRVGPGGFRAGKARILAVHLPLTIGNKEHLRAEALRRQREAEARAARQAGVLSPRPPRIPDFTGRVINIGTDHVPWPLRNSRPEPVRWVAREVPEPELPTEEEIAAEKTAGEAWVAVIGDRLRQLYPGVEVCETRNHLMAKYPPDKVYYRGQQY